MEKRNLISVIIPTYNASPFINQCLESIISQSYKHLEIIVVDDGSKDDTVEIIKRYPVKLIQQTNQGAAAARNTGMEAATGEYLHFMDADDLINLDFYERLLTNILSVDADMACSGYVHERLPVFTTIITERFLYVNTDDKMRFANVIHQGNIWKYLFRLSFLREYNILFDEELRNAHDKAFTIQAVYFSNKIISVPGAVYYYKERVGSLVTSRIWGGRRIKNQSIAKANEFCKQFAKEHAIQVLGAPRYVTFHLTLFGILPILVKRVYITGRIRWYLFGLFILQLKAIPASRRLF